jgi:hypothetical protein
VNILRSKIEAKISYVKNPEKYRPGDRRKGGVG